ncbi:DNA primase [Ralstonia phage vB_RsoP_BMB50]|uniref:DNA primase n=1 Tax=Ralstonia phage vB_RsoP_BMB50 TaxID=2834269 RepID=A0A8E5KHM5_9CAUD|nr:DNA primase [Ralstonia phage vB_RsoP_BMB50]
MIDPSEWLKQAQALPEGASRRIGHVCGDGTPLLISHEVGRWRAWCHRCHEPGMVDKPAESLAEKLERRRKEAAVAAQLQRSVRLPQPMEFNASEWPLPARIWLYKAGLSNHHINQLGAYWHEPSGRVVLPIFDGEDVVYWQARDPSWRRGSDRPKYLNPKVDKAELVARYGSGTPLVFTEDVLSAFRVGQVTEAWSLLGTQLTTEVAAKIGNREVAIWLDPDAAGRKASRTVRKSLAMMGVPYRVIKSERDPKLLSKEEIWQHLYSSQP